MSLTLTQGNMFSTTTLQRIVTDLLVKDSRVLELLPFEELMGNSLTYDVITTDSSAEFYDVNETIAESTAEMTQYTVTLKKLIGDADVDELLRRTRSNQIDLKAQVLANKVKALQYKFLDTFYYGNATSNPKEFDGLHVLMTSTTYNTVHAGSSTGTALSMAKLYQAIDLVTGIKATHILMSKTMRRGIQVYLDSEGDHFPTSRDNFGRMIETFGGLEIVADDHIGNVEVAASGAFSTKTDGANTSIFIVSLGSPQSICGVQGTNKVEVEDLGKLETKDSTRTRVKWYCGLKLENIRFCAKVDGIVAAGTVTA
jgi:hypothetical protein